MKKYRCQVSLIVDLLADGHDQQEAEQLAEQLPGFVKALKIKGTRLLGVKLDECHVKAPDNAWLTILEEIREKKLAIDQRREDLRRRNEEWDLRKQEACQRLCELLKPLTGFMVLNPNRDVGFQAESVKVEVSLSTDLDGRMVIDVYPILNVQVEIVGEEAQLRTNGVVQTFDDVVYKCCTFVRDNICY